ncbi:hypothetical protein B5S28_g5152 [[Candida] boidinii]|nr:hypothetical protein B5S28_g5152 [[Candida] boidinii]
MSGTTRPHSRQTSLGSSFTSSSAMGLGINNNNGNKSSSQSTPSKNHPVKIGPWKLGRTLGRGATGRVLLASNVRSGRKAAVKVVNKAVLNMNPDISETEKGCDSAGLSYGIEREIIIMKLLNHKNVLRLYDVYETEKALYLVLEYVEGGELFDLLVESGPLPEATAVEFFKQIILGASYCHNLGICHRDLKPENLLLDRNLSIKIADFGMAALESKDRLLETSCGSPHYAAPEIVSGLKYHGTASDVWSCGVILFALLTGRLPFDDENVRNVLLKVQGGRYSYQEDDEVSDEAKDLIARMLTVDPTKRILSRDILKHRLIQKYPFNEQDMNDYLNLPSAESATRPVNSREELDEDILKNLVILWHGREEESIIQDLLSPEPNQVKTFYSLLVRYRHDNKLKNSSDLVRSSSVISKISTNSNTPKRRSKRFSNSISASSAHRRSVTYQNSNISTSTTPTKQKRDSSSYNLPVLPTGSYNELVNIQRSGVQSSPERVTPDRSSPQRTPHRSPHRSSYKSSSPYRSSPNKYHNSVSASPSRKRASMISLANSISNNKRASLMFANDTNKKINVRNSVTTKLLSTYAKLSSLEEKENVDDYGKRTSADFGKLCELLFNGEKSEAAALASSSSMATLSALIFDGAQSQLSPRRQNRRISASPRKRASRRSHRQSAQMTKKQSEYATALLNHIEQEIEEYKEYENEDAEYNDKVIRLLPEVEDPPVREIQPTKRSNRKSKSRISSNPLERISRILNPKDFEKMDRRTVSANAENKRISSLQSAAPTSETPVTPPKPMSRLDPRYGAYKQYKRRVSQDAQRLLEASIAEEEERERRRIREEKEAAARRAAEEAALAAEAEAEAARRVYEVRNGGRLGKAPYRYSSYSKRNTGKPKDYDNDDSDDCDNEENDEYNKDNLRSKAKSNARSARSKANKSRGIEEGQEGETGISTPGFTEDETTETATGTETETDYPDDTEDDYYGYEDEYINGAVNGRNMKSGKYSSRARDEFDNQSTAGTITKEFMADLKKAHIIDSQFSGLRIRDESSNALSSSRMMSNNRLSARYSRGGDYDPNGVITSKNSVRKNSKRNSMLPPSTIADVVVPEVTRRSKQFPGNSNRLSVLSIYSTKESSTNIHGLLNSTTGNESGKNSKSARHSQLFLEDPIKLRDDNRKIGQIQEDDEFNFIDNSNGLSSKRKSIADDLQNFGKYEDENPIKNKKDNIPNLKYKASNDTLISKDSEGELYKSYKIPEVPGSPLKDSANAIDNFGVRIASSKYSTEKLDVEDRKYSSLIEDDKGEGNPEFEDAGKLSTYNNTNPKRKPLGEIDIETQKRNENKSNVIKPTYNNESKKEKVKSSEVRTSSGNSFLRKISFGKRSSSNEDENQRKSSFANAFLSLFQSHNGNDQVKNIAEIKSILNKNDIFEALRSLLVSWKQHGVENLIITNHSFSISAGISKNNALGLKTCRFNVEALPVPNSKSNAHSKLVFHNLKGSNKTFERLVNEIQRILEKEGVLAA